LAEDAGRDTVNDGIVTRLEATFRQPVAVRLCGWVRRERFHFKSV